MRVVLLDTRNHVLSIPTIYIGSLNHSVLRVGELFRTSIREYAASIIVAHNHPSGDPSPSPEDVVVTRRIVEAGKLLVVGVLDHIIIGGNCFVSPKERRMGLAKFWRQIVLESLAQRYARNIVQLLQIKANNITVLSPYPLPPAAC